MDILTIREKKISKIFLKNGYYIFNIKDKKILNNLSNQVINKSSKILKKKFNKKFLYFTHKYIKNENLNNYRLEIYNFLNKDKNFLKSYYKMGKEYLDILCGNELAMQKKINLSIQLPNDNSSILPIHTDVWSGNSPFEVVLWIPLVSVQKTKSMFILSPKITKYYFNNIKKFKSTENIFNHAKRKLNWLKLNYGQGLIFSQNLLHGNVENHEKTTRWSLNCRFKSLFSPYDKKKYGEYFTAINTRPSSILGINYEDPKL